MPKVYFGRKTDAPFELKQSSDLIAVRTRSGRSLRRSIGPVPSPVEEELKDAAIVAAFPEANVEVFRVPVKEKSALDRKKRALRTSPDVRFAGGVLIDPVSKEPVLYTENLFVKFIDSADPEECRDVLRAAGLTIKDEPAYASNAFFAEAPEGTGQKVFEIAEKLLDREDVEYSHPELIRKRKSKQIFASQWHLKRTTIGGVVINASAEVDAAHQVTRGEGITIAVIDDGIDIDHPEFASAGKVVAPRDATLQSNNPRPKDPFGTGPDRGENHGTACAGVATADGTLGASGVAPAARLIPIRLASGLGSQREADAFVWAANHGADVISCSWGPEDGDWWRPSDPAHSQVTPLPPNARLAIDYVTANGRGGKGCVVLFAAGNGNESVDNDGYASNPKVIAVAACNDTGKRSVYSDFGNAVWCSFPSDDSGHAPFNHPTPLTPGIWTVDRVNTQGYNVGRVADGDSAGMFYNAFGGTSSACPGAAGVAALVLSVNPALTWSQVKDLFKRACDRIDPQGGQYDAAGHSRFFGFGRLNARTAVELARPQPQSEITVSRRFDGAIPDMQTVTFSLDVAEGAPIQSVRVGVELEHSYIGDLIVTLVPPSVAGTAIVLHNRSGGTSNSIRKTYDKTTVPALGALAGRTGRGRWTLRIRDAAALDSGKLITFSLTLSFAHPDRAVRPPPPESTAKRKTKKPSRRKARKYKR